ncbi:unannotated protein [freshwater metagenome]|uniref:Unannotated protein n=1 Tax=freshwater metagenome TaxID=449393 RepID=A0A6J6PUZ4_9ZZZZ
MRNKAMPDDRMESFRVRRDARGINGRNDHDTIANLLGVAAVPADHAEDLHAPGLGFLQPGDDVDADVLFEVAAADRKHEHRVVLVAFAHL